MSVESQVGAKWDRVITNSIIYTTTGLVVGGVFSLALFRKARWPPALGVGFALGKAYSEAQVEFSHEFSPLNTKWVPADDAK